MELRQLRHFLEIARCASFRQAADNLHLTQPALSKSIRNLENTLQVTLLERGPTGVVPTEYGRVLLDYASFVDVELGRAKDELDLMRGTGKGTVRIGVGTSILRYLLPDVVRRFLEANPGVSVSLVEGLKADLFARLRRGEVDLVVSSVKEEPDDPDLAQRIILRDRISVVAAKGHPLQGKPRVTLEDLSAHKWVIPGPNEPEGQMLALMMARAGLERPDLAIRTSSSLAMAALLPGTTYLSYLPAKLLELDASYSQLVRLDTETVWRDTFVGISHRRRGIMLPVARQFMRAMTEAAESMQEMV